MENFLVGVKKVEKRYKQQQTDMEEIRLNKFLSDAGVCSRREADRLIEAGRIMVNDKLPVMGQKVTSKDIVKVDNKIVSREDRKSVV